MLSEVATEVDNGGPSETTVVSVLGEEEFAVPIMVSHIPQSVLVGSEASNVSLASDNSTVMRPTSQSQDDDTVDVITVAAAATCQDSWRESSQFESCQISNEARLIGGEPTIEKSLLRKVSDSDVEDLRPTKKARVQPASREPCKWATPLQLLACPDDALVLNALHVFVRQQIEVFTATSEDLAQPAPGRKYPIRLQQVGLRCIHCRRMPSRDRVKRAICYPSSIGRVYHSVSDMKFDHFSSCKGLPQDLRETFDDLKMQCKRGGDRRQANGSSSSTAQYYHDAALRMGMEDKGEGIFMMGQAEATRCPETSQMNPASSMTQSFSQARQGQYELTPHVSIQSNHSNTAQSAPTFQHMALFHQANMAAFQHAVAHGFANYRASTAPSQPQHEQQEQPKSLSPVAKLSSSPFPKLYIAPSKSVPVVPRAPSEEAPVKKVVPRCLTLATQSDTRYLNALHCFVRRHVEIFVATEEDIAAPSPGRKTRIMVGQVGIRCIHCAQLPVKSRVKRAVCYPPSVSGIYHSVSNMKFDHFGCCRGLPSHEREVFIQLRASFHRRGGSTSNGSRGMANSTAQFYHDSALGLGLKDTSDGIRLTGTTATTTTTTTSAIDDDDDAVSEVQQQQQQRKEEATKGISALMIAATDPVVRAEYNRIRANSGSGGSNY